MTLDEQIAAVTEAKVKLVSGSQTERVDLGDYSVTFTRTNLNQIDALLAQLQAQKAGQPMRGAIGIVF